LRLALFCSRDAAILRKVGLLVQAELDFLCVFCVLCGEELMM
jgi:hypothetical protein